MSLDTNLVATNCVDDGVVPWVREVLQEVLKRSFPCHVVLNYESQERQHSQSPYTDYNQINKVSYTTQFYRKNKQMKRLRENKAFTICKFLLLGLQSWCKVQGVEDTSRVSQLVWGQAILLEDGVLVHTARVLDVLPSSDLHIMEQDELNHKEGGGWCKVLWFPCIIPLRGIDDSNFRENLRKQHSCNTQHRPAPIHKLSLNIPLQVFWVLGKPQRVKPVVTGKTISTTKHRLIIMNPFSSEKRTTDT